RRRGHSGQLRAKCLHLLLPGRPLRLYNRALLIHPERGCNTCHRQQPTNNRHTLHRFSPSAAVLPVIAPGSGRSRDTLAVIRLNLRDSKEFMATGLRATRTAFSRIRDCKTLETTTCACAAL